MSADENRAVARRVYELLGVRSFDRVRTLVAPDFVDHTQLAPGAASIVETVGMLTRAFPDLAHQIEDQIAEGDKVVTRYTWRGTHRGAFAEIAATGKRVQVGGIDIFRLRQGKLTDVWRCENSLRLLQQLGVVPEMLEEGARY